MKIIAHRSGPENYPEQTVTAALDSLSRGADAIELDVRLSSDGKLIISHDRNLKRIFGVDKNTDELTQEEFFALERADGYRGYTLTDYISAGAMPILIHIKEAEALEQVLELAREKGVENKIVIGAQTIAEVKQTKNFNPEIKVLAFMKKPVYTSRFIAAGVDYIRLWEGNYTARRRNFIHSKGVKLAIMTGGYNGFDVGYTSNEKLKFFVAEGVDAILLNEVSHLTGK